MNTTSHETNALQTVNATQVDAPRSNAGALMMNIPAMESMMRVAELMASGRSTVPAHLQKNPADCMAVVMQSMQWGMNPFAVAQKTHLVNGALGYEAQLVNAVVQESGAIEGRFHYEYKGAAGSVECRVGAKIRGEAEITWGEWLSEAKVTTKNSPLWKTNPRQQMGYLQVKNWARAHTPGAILGVYTPDEFDTPAPRDMGQAQVVRPVLSAELLQAADTAAAAGVTAYQTFWKGAGQDNRKLLAGEHERLKALAIQTDKSRTVDAPATAPPAKPEVSPAGQPDADGVIQPAKTFDDVMALLCTAKSEDALYVAAEWIEPLADVGEKALLNSKFEERLEVMRGAA